MDVWEEEEEKTRNLTKLGIHKINIFKIQPYQVRHICRDLGLITKTNFIFDQGWIFSQVYKKHQCHKVWDLSIRDWR